MPSQIHACSFCALAHGDPKQCFTEWFFLGEGIIIVEDRDRKGHVMRILVVCEEHLPCFGIPPELVKRMKRYGLAVAKAIAISRGLKITGCDDQMHSYPDHYHIQYTLD